MSIGSISSSTTYQVPVTAQAKADDERTESAAVKAREAATGKDVAAPVQSKSNSTVDIRA